MPGDAEKAEPQMSIQFVAFKAKVEDSLLRDRLMATLSSFFGFLAAALATVGLYGVISYVVERRRGEIGISYGARSYPRRRASAHSQRSGRAAGSRVAYWHCSCHEQWESRRNIPLRIEAY